MRSTSTVEKDKEPEVHTHTHSGGPGSQGHPPATQEKPMPGQGTSLEVVDYGDDAGAGLDNIKAEEFTIPFVRVLDAKSPQCDRAKASGKLIKGAMPGMILVTSTQEIFPGEDIGMDVMFVDRSHQFIEYTVGKEGSQGEFVGVHSDTEQLVIDLRAKHGKFGKIPMPNSNVLVETYSLYGFFFPTPTFSFRGVLSLQSTQIPKYNTFMEIVGGIEYLNSQGGMTNPPMWGHRWHLGTRGESNKKGSYWGYTLNLVNEATRAYPRPARIERTDPLYAKGKAFFESIRAGRVKIKRDDDEASEATAKVGDNIEF